MRLKWAIGLVASVGILALSALLVAPVLLSSDTAKARVAERLEELTGHVVRLSGTSRVSFNPYLSVTYEDASVSDGTGDLIAVDEVRAEFGFGAALLGQASLGRLHLVRPRFDVLPLLDTLRSSGRIGSVLTGRDSEAAKLFDVTMEDGTLGLPDGGKATRVAGTLSWRSTDRPLTAELTGVWRGRPMALDAEIVKPANLFAGPTPSATRFVVTTEGASAEVSGTFQLAAATGPIWDGTVQMAAQKPAELATWLKWSAPDALGMRPLSMTGRGTLRGGELAFTDLSVKIGDGTGTGRLDIRRNAMGTTRLDGTVAFDKLHFPELRFGSDVSSSGLPMLADFTQSQDIAIDLRLSAATASFGSIGVRDFAGGLIASQGAVSLDVGAARWAEGNLVGRLVHAGAERKTTVEGAVDGFDLAGLSQWLPVEISGVGGVSGNLTTHADDPTKRTGRLQLSSTAGVLEGFDLDKVVVASNAADNLDLESVAGTTAFSDLTVNVAVDGEVARLSGLSFDHGGRSVRATGRSDLSRGTLAVQALVFASKSVAKAFGNGVFNTLSADVRPLSIFIGGTIDAPLIIPQPERSPATPPAAPVKQEG